MDPLEPTLRNMREDLERAWNLPWLEMEVLIGGKSSIDLPRMRVKDWQEATAFICNYGFDPSDDKDRRFMHGVFIEAVNFIERFLLPADAQVLTVPDQIVQCVDLRHILLWASGVNEPTELLRSWSCAILRVLHTIAHIEGTQRRIGVRLASEQIRERFLPYIRVAPDGRLYLGDAKNFIELERIEWKIGKSRESTILKLLHKRANVAETIYDMMGVRIVTKRICDVMMVIKFLRKFHMITFANCVPGRTRNNLIDVESFKQSARKLRKLLKNGRVEPEQFLSLLDQASVPPESVDDPSNPHSGLNYRSIQLTCRQFIRASNPNLLWIDRLEAYVADLEQQGDAKQTQKILDSIKSWPGVAQNRDVAVFFPFEVQVMDRAAFYASQVGEAAHDRYKNSQVRAARRRVLSEVIALGTKAV